MISGRIGMLPICFLLAACAIQRAQVANEAQSKMVGLTKELVLACMGPPLSRMAEGTTEVWSYNSGNGRTTVSTWGSSNTNATVYGGPNYASGSALTTRSGTGVSTRRFCTVNVVMNADRVERVNYVGPTGGLLTAGEQCAFAVENCAR